MKRLALILALLLTTPVVQAGTKRPPNILVIVADDLGYADLGFQGCKDIPTPNLDRLAKQGVRFTNGYVSGPYCSPTRAGLLTGRYQTRFGHEFNPGGGKDGKDDGPGLPLSETTLANRLKNAGYVTGLIGKWHLGGAAPYHPQKRGFDEFYGFLGGSHSYFNDKGPAILRGATAITEKEYLTDAFGREAVAFIERHKQRPFFLYLAFNAVHTPMHAPEERIARFGDIKDPTRRTYAAMLSAMDDAVGNVLNKLSDAGLEEETLIVFFSDNGGPVMVGTTINGSRNLPLRGSKRTTLEGGIRVPFVMAWKGRVPADRTFDAPVIQLDVVPTALAAAGTLVPAKGLDGVDLLPHVNRKKTGVPHETLYWRLGKQMAIRSGDWVLVRYDTAAEGGGAAKKRAAAGISPVRLYNLREDIGQTRDLAPTDPERVRQLQSAWDRWNAEQAAPLWGGGKKAQ